MTSLMTIEQNPDISISPGILQFGPEVIQCKLLACCDEKWKKRAHHYFIYDRIIKDAKRNYLLRELWRHCLN